MAANKLQMRLMRFADRYAGFVTQAIDDVERLQSTPEARREFNAPLVYSIAAAYTKAADARPQVALLDMVVMTTLGRMVFEEHWRPRYGASARPAVPGKRSWTSTTTWSLTRSEARRSEGRRRAFVRPAPRQASGSVSSPAPVPVAMSDKEADP